MTRTSCSPREAHIKRVGTVMVLTRTVEMLRLISNINSGGGMNGTRNGGGFLPVLGASETPCQTFGSGMRICSSIGSVTAAISLRCIKDTYKIKRGLPSRRMWKECSTIRISLSSRTSCPRPTRAIPLHSLEEHLVSLRISPLTTVRVIPLRFLPLSPSIELFRTARRDWCVTYVSDQQLLNVDFVKVESHVPTMGGTNPRHTVAPIPGYAKFARRISTTMRWAT